MNWFGCVIMLDMSQKTVLFIAPSFYGYEKAIIGKLKKLFKKVIYVNETINNNSLYYKFVNNFANDSMPEAMEHFFINSVKQITRDVDFVFCIRCYYLNLTCLEYMHNYFKKGCKFINYQWDSSDIVPIIKETFNLYDRVLTFDIKDSSQFGWIYRPLFYIKEYLDNQNSKVFDVLSVCSYNSERYRIYDRLKRYLLDKGLDYSINIYCKPSYYFLKKYIKKDKGFVNVSYNNLSSRKLSLGELYSMYARAKCVFDNTISEQTGFTMRTIECIGSKCKLITNNKMIFNADFYNENNYYYYNKDEYDIDLEFIRGKYIELPYEIYNRYSLDSFLEDIFREG